MVLFLFPISVIGQTKTEPLHFGTKKQGSKTKMSNFFKQKSSSPSFHTESAFVGKTAKPKLKTKDAFSKKVKSKGPATADGFTAESSKNGHGSGLKDSFLSKPKESNAQNEGNFFSSSNKEGLTNVEGNFFTKGKGRERKRFAGEKGILNLSFFSSKKPEKAKSNTNDSFTFSKKSEKRMRDRQQKKKSENELFQPGVLKKNK